MTDDSASRTEGAPDIEARLRHALAQRADGEPVNPADWATFAGRLASATQRRQRALVGAVALALLVGAAGGYLGEAAASPGQTAARAPGASATADGSRAPGRARSLSPSASGPAMMCPNVSSGSADTAPGTTSSGTGPTTSARPRASSSGPPPTA